MKIKYTVWHYERTGRKKVTKFTNGELEWPGDWDKDNHDEIRELIRKENEDKSIVGYGPEEKWGEFKNQMQRDHGVTL